MPSIHPLWLASIGRSWIFLRCRLYVKIWLIGLYRALVVSLTPSPKLFDAHTLNDQRICEGRFNNSCMCGTVITSLSKVFCANTLLSCSVFCCLGIFCIFQVEKSRYLGLSIVHGTSAENWRGRPVTEIGTGRDWSFETHARLQNYKITERIQSSLVFL